MATTIIRSLCSCPKARSILKNKTTNRGLHPLETGGSVSLKRYYEQRGVPGEWDASRVRRLGKLLRLSDYELAAMFCIKNTQLKRWLTKGLLPPYVALHFALLENWVAQQRISKQDPVIEFP